MNRIQTVSLVFAIFAGHCLAADPPAVRWPQFRGDNSSGVAAEGGTYPTEFDSTKNLLWKTPLPPGHSSPCIWGNRIFLTAFDKSTRKLETICLDRTNGQIIWRQPAPADRIEKVHATGSPAVATPGTDGERVYVYFGSCGLLCYDMAGRELWKVPLPMPVTTQGTGASPIVVGELVLLNREFKPEPCLMAVHGRTGEVAWKLPRKLADMRGPNEGYATPVLWNPSGGNDVVVHSPRRLTAHDVSTGAERWSLRFSSSACTTPVVGDGTLFVVGFRNGMEADESDPLPTFDELLKQAGKGKDGTISREELPKLDLFRRPESSIQTGTALTLQFIVNAIDANRDGQISREEWDKFVDEWTRTSKAEESAFGFVAIRPAGRDAATAPQIAWRDQKKLPEVASPLYYRDRLYTVRDGGLISCLEAKTGREIYRERLGPRGSYFASPIAADGKIYAASLDGTISVVAAGDALKVLARNRLGEAIAATPAAVDGKLYVRTDKHLWAFGE